VRQGQLIHDPDGEHATLVFERMLDHAPPHVWDAISTPEGMYAWLLCTSARIDGYAGGDIELVSGPPGYRSTGKILRWDPPRVFEYEWNVAPVPEMPRGERAIFCYELFAVGEGTRLVVTYRRITKQSADGFLPGVHVFLDRLEAQLAGASLPNWFERFSEVAPSYPAWTEHAARARQ